MMRLRTIYMLVLGVLAFPGVLRAQWSEEWTLEPLNPEHGWVEMDWRTMIATATNGVIVRYGGAVLTADQVQLNEATGEAVADGSVHIQQGDQIWVSEHIRYNFKTRQMDAAQFRSGQSPIFLAGQDLRADTSNHVFFTTNAFVTTDDIAQPAVKVKAKFLRIIPGQRVTARHATLYVGGVPLFYFPYYSRRLGPHANDFTVTPGFRRSFGPYLLGSYTWYLSEQLDGELHADYRERRGFGGGPDVNYHLGPWGDGTLKYYYTHDHEPMYDQLGVPITRDRQRVNLSYQSMPATNLSVKAMVRYESDLAVVRDFFEGEYRQNPQPNTYFEVNRFWQNFSLDAYAEPRLNRFLDVIERLPDVRLTGYRQELGETPLYYESESSAGYYRHLYAVDAGTNGPATGLNYEAARADTYHQIVLPQTFFGWLNFTPRVGGRFTYYSEASGPGSTTSEQYRGVFNTGAELSFKASRLWPDVQSQLLDMDGLRHIVEPSINYVFVPSPNVAPNRLPQFDSELPSLRILPLEFPDYTAIDSVDSENVIRWGLRNKFQTKREGQVANLATWDLYTDWRLKPRDDQYTFSDIYSDITLAPRSWITLESITRYDIHDGQFSLSFHTLTLRPSNVWSWSLGHFYLRDDLRPVPTALGVGNNLFTSTMQYRLNENWGLRASHYFEARTGRLEEQAYSVFRDLRSWTAALTLFLRENVIGPEDYGISFTFSLKAYPRYGVGTDSPRPYSLLGG